MKHLGDITKINGAEIEPVHCIIGGSPCQDLSIAGKRAGLAGARSGLFMEQIRIVKEMRQESERSNKPVRPRYMVWENVPGAFSSNRGRDFAAVLEEIIRIVEPEAPDIEVPEKGWPTWGGYHDAVGGRWSVEWRVHDAQYWGVAQRRRRISVVADFGGDTAGEILFERKSMSGYSAPRGEAGERPTGDAENGINPTIARSLTARADGSPCADTAGCNGRGWREDQCYTLNTIDRPAVCAGFKLGNGIKSRSIGYGEECAPTLNAECGGNKPAVLLDMSHANDVIRECGEIAPSLQARMGTGGNQIPFTYQFQSFGEYRAADVASCCKSRDGKDSTDLVCAVDCRNFKEREELNGTLQAKESGQSYNLNNVVRTHMVVRRLTPLECERLQGFPDGWTDIGEWRDSKGKLHKPADSPRYKALGNSIALPFWDFLAKRISAQYLHPITIGSLFDGIGGFPLVFEKYNGKGTARWASEIEEFPIAVTKIHFKEN